MLTLVQVPIPGAHLISLIWALAELTHSTLALLASIHMLETTFYNFYPLIWYLKINISIYLTKPGDFFCSCVTFNENEEVKEIFRLLSLLCHSFVTTRLHQLSTSYWYCHCYCQASPQLKFQLYSVNLVPIKFARHFVAIW